MLKYISEKQQMVTIDISYVDNISGFQHPGKIGQLRWFGKGILSHKRAFFSLFCVMHRLLQSHKKHHQVDNFYFFIWNIG
jgi:hypothetical protein